MRVVDGDELGLDPTLRPRADVGEVSVTLKGPKRRTKVDPKPEAGELPVAEHEAAHQRGYYGGVG